MIDKNTLTFIINRNVDPIIDCKYCNINLNDIDHTMIYKNKNNGIILNTVPVSGEQCLDFTDEFLYDKWLKKNLYKDSILSIEDYIEIYHKQNPEIDKNYFKKYYEYHVNCFDMIKNLIYDYYWNFIIINAPKIKSELYFSKSKKTFQNFEHVNKCINNLDVENNYTFDHLNKMYSIHSDGIYRNSLISVNKKEFIDVNKYDDYKNNLNIFTKNVDMYNKLKILIKAYYYCSLTNFVIRQYVFKDTVIDKILLEVYNNTNFSRPIANFDVIF